MSSLNGNFNEILNSKTLAEEYGDSAIMKSIVQLFPGGSIVDTALSVNGNKIKDVRIRKLFIFIKEAIDKLDREKISIEWIESVEFYDILQAAILSSANTRSEEKIKVNAMILTNVISGGENDKNYRPEEYLSALSDLTPLECKVLFTFNKRFQKISDSSGTELKKAKEMKWKEAIIEECKIDLEDVSFIMKRLERSGFVKEITGTYLSYIGGEYTQTEAMSKFIEYLSMNPLYSTEN
ncbi:hypothetical protein CN277_11100 [Bacillus cereus]|uniref:hypothetical protein n=1 Tax=Bacillus cereus TaxID=1396 RepID=UPI000BEB58A9|nr:hypothetical protein [Bacillus cereus]PEE56858.1 hypothetical protein COM68_22255 [Bacillus cereus]PFC62507.1 hypothetical protein CN267_08570 [Bacillus cereus]PFD02791.1 hypothetical protein CN277_11100 [Bacillus cereus]